MNDQNASSATQITGQTAAAAEPVETQKVLTSEGVEIAAIEDLNDPGLIAKPATGENASVSVDAGKDYILSFAEDEMLSFVQEGDQMTITFNDGSTLVIENFVSATSSSDPAHLVFQSVDGVLDTVVVDTTPDQDELEDPQTDVREELAESLEIAQEEIAEQLNEELEPAAGEEAQTLAQIEPAAGDTGGPENSGFTFTDPTITPVGPLSAIGPIGPTLLNYGVDYNNDIVRPEDEVQNNAAPDDQPIIVDPAAMAFDETDLVPGGLSQSDTVVADFGRDGPGTITPDGTFTVSGSVAGGTLTSNGTPVDITPTAGGYVGTAGGAPIFELTIDPTTGDYTFTLTGVIDHADGTDPNDVIRIQFGVTATDSDGDTVGGTITVDVADDAPETPADDAFTVDEDNLGPITINDSLSADFGNDGAGAVAPNGSSSFSGVTTLTAGGVPVVISATATGYEGLAGASKIFDITFDAATGDYAFTLYAPVDHDDPGSDTITVNFGASVTDYDGDSTSATVTVNITDSVPKFGDTPVIGKGIETVDETNFTAAGTSVSGSVDIDFGSDGGAIATTGSYQVTGSVAGGTLTSGGEAVTITSTPTGYTGTINGGAGTVFTITVDATNGDYTYTQALPFDHADGANPNDQITLQFGLIATDGDGDTDDGQITIHVLDDAPSIDSPAVKTINEQDVDTAPQTVSGTLSHDFGEDGAGSIDPTGTSSFTGVTSLTSNGEAITINAVAGGYEGILAGGGKAFEITIDPATGAYSFTQYVALDHAPGSDELTLNFGVGITDFDTDTDTANIAIKIKDSTPEINDTPTVGKGIETVDETNLPGGATASGQIDIDYGSDTPGTLHLSGITSSSVPLVSGGQPVTISQTAGGYIGTINGGADTVFTLTVDASTGAYEFTQVLPLEHPDATDHNDAIQIKFGVVAEDADGDTDVGDITINVLDDGPMADDDTATLNQSETTVSGNVMTNDDGGNDTPANVTAIEFGGTTLPIVPGTPTVINGTYGSLSINSDGTYTYTSKGTNTSVVSEAFNYTLTDADGDIDNATLTITLKDVDDKPILADPDPLMVDETDLDPTDTDGDTISADFGNDGPGTYNVTDASTVTFSGAKDGALTSNGVPVTIAIVGNSYVGSAGAKEVFRLDLNETTGEYDFILTGTLDHADPTDPDDIIELNFEVQAEDSDGDTDTGTITVAVKDDGPVANDDHNTYDTTTGIANGNVITGLNGGPGAADELSKDNGTTEAHDHDVIQVSFKGNVVDVPAGGTASIEGDNGTLVIKDDGSYTYTLKSSVSAPSGATHTLNPTAADAAGTQNAITKDGITVTAITGGDLTFTDDGFGIQDGGGTNRVYGNDEKLNITFPNAETAEITVGDIANNPGSALDLVIYLSDGSTQTIEVPSASIVQGNGTGTISLKASDFGSGVFIKGVDLFSHDNSGYAKTSFSLVEVEVTEPGTDCIMDKFEYVLSDGDGDTDQATLELCGKDLTNDKPTVSPSTVTVDETDLAPTDTDSGVIVADFGADAPGSYTPTGESTFTFTGAKGGALTSNGIPVTVSVDGNDYVGTAGSEEIFRLELNKTTGAYEFILKGTLDHADVTDHDDTIVLEFGVTAQDSDDDSAETTITVNVKDDGPIANDDHNSYDTTGGGTDGNVITGLNGGAGAADQLSKDNGPSEAHDHDVVKVSFKGTSVDVPEGGSATIEGDNGTLTIFDNGEYTYALKPGAATSVVGDAIDFTETLEFPVLTETVAISGDTLNNLGILNGALDFTGDVQASVKYVSEGAGYSNTLGGYTVAADGTIEPASVIVKNGNAASPNDTASFDATSGESIGFFIIADGFTANNGYSGIDLSKGTLEFIYGYGTPGERAAKITDNGADIKLVHTSLGGAETVLKGAVYHTTTRGESTNLNADSTVRVLSGLADDADPTTLRIGFEDLPQLGDKDYQDIIFDVQLKPVADCIMDQFEYTLRDGDGDTDTAILELCGKDMTDDNPIIATPKDLKVDESDLNPTDTDAAVISADFGTDGPGEFTATGSSTFGYAGAKNGNLTSHGQPVSVSVEGNYYVGKANGSEVFRLELNKTTGAYEFILLGVLDHADATNPNDIITLDFGITATDKDGDLAETTVTVYVKDDGPIANDDYVKFEQAAKTYQGDVTTNDEDSMDVPNMVTKISFGSTHVNVPTNGAEATIKGDFGTLNIKADGTYTYTLDAALVNATAAGTTYTLNPNSGDVAGWSTTLSKNGFVIKGTNSDNNDLTWVSEDGSGIGIAGGSDKVYPYGEKLDIDFVEDAQTVKFTIADIGSNDVNKGLDFILHFTDGSTLNHEVNIGDYTVVGGKIVVEFDSADFGGKLFDQIDITSVRNSHLGKASFLLNNVEYETPGEVCETKDVFEYTFTDYDGDSDTATLTLETECAPLPPEGKCIVGDCWNNVLIGTDGSDQIYGLQGNDKITGGAGNDLLYGGSGKDTFIFKSITDGVDTIGDFQKGYDHIDVSELLQGYDALQDSIDDFVFATEVGGNTHISVDADGAGQGVGAVEIAVLHAVTGIDIEETTNNGETTL